MNKIKAILLASILLASQNPSATLLSVTAPAAVSQVSAGFSRELDSFLSFDVRSAQLQPIVIGQLAAAPAPTLKQIAEDMVTAQFGSGQFYAVDYIVSHESDWNPEAVNASSGACGLGQALPCSKMQDRSPEGQLKWVLGYIAERYQTPAQAMAFWIRHHWY